MQVGPATPAYGSEPRTRDFSPAAGPRKKPRRHSARFPSANENGDFINTLQFHLERSGRCEPTTFEQNVSVVHGFETAMNYWFCREVAMKENEGLVIESSMNAANCEKRTASIFSFWA